MIRLNDLYPPKGTNKKPKRVGRGIGSGHGKTSCRGHKGQKARSGSPRLGFEGGQMPLGRRVPKRGFRNKFKKKFQIINIEQLNQFKKDSTVTAELLQDQKLIKNSRLPIKLLGKGKISKALNVRVQRVSKQAKEKIEKAGGKVQLC